MYKIKVTKEQKEQKIFVIGRVIAIVTTLAAFATTNEAIYCLCRKVGLKNDAARRVIASAGTLIASIGMIDSFDDVMSMLLEDVPEKLAIGIADNMYEVVEDEEE